MTQFQVLVEFIRNEWHIVAAVAVILIPPVAGVFHFIFKNRLEEANAKLRNLETKFAEYARNASQNQSHAILRQQIEIIPDMRDGITEAVEKGAKRILVLCYVGNYIRRTLENLPKRLLDGVELRMISRNPNVPWKLPADESRQCAIR
jgi:cell division protein FtsB